MKNIFLLFIWMSTIAIIIPYFYLERCEPKKIKKYPHFYIRNNKYLNYFECRFFCFEALRNEICECNQAQLIFDHR